MTPLAFGVSLIVLSFLLALLFKAPPMYIGLVKILGIPWRTIREGPFLKIPYIETVDLFSIQLQLDRFETVVKSKDHLTLQASGGVQYVPDRKLLSAYQNKEETREKDLTDFIKNELTILAESNGG